MNIDQLRYLLEINKCSSISKAAENLHISHQALSASIRSLEKELNVSLMDKTPRGTKLTLRGKQLVEISTDFIHTLDDIFYSQKRAERIKLTVIGSYMSITNYVSEKIYELSQEGFEIDPIFLEDNNNYNIINLIANNEADIGFFAVFRNENQKNLEELKYLQEKYPALVYKSVIRLPIFCELAEAHPLAYLEKIPLKKLQNYSLCYFYPRLSSQENEIHNKKMSKNATELFVKFFSQYEFTVESNPTIYARKIQSAEYVGITVAKNSESIYAHKRVPLIEECYFEVFAVRKKQEKYSEIEERLYQIF